MINWHWYDLVIFVVAYETTKWVLRLLAEYIQIRKRARE